MPRACVFGRYGPRRQPSSRGPKSRTSANLLISRLRSFWAVNRISPIGITDLALIPTATYFAFWLRFDGDIAPQYYATYRETLPWLFAIRGIAFLCSGSTAACGVIPESGISRESSWRCSPAAWRCTLSSTASLDPAIYPRSIVIIDSFLLVCFLGGARLLWRVLPSLIRTEAGRRVLIIGAGDAGEMIVRDMREGRRLSSPSASSTTIRRSWAARFMACRCSGTPGGSAARHRGDAARTRCWSRCRARRRRRFAAVVDLLEAVQAADHDAAQLARARERQVARQPDPASGDRRSAAARAGRPRHRRGAGGSSRASASWSPAPADRSAPSCAGRLRRSSRQPWFSTSATRTACTPSPTISPTGRVQRVDPSVIGDVTDVSAAGRRCSPSTGRSWSSMRRPTSTCR